MELVKQKLFETVIIWHPTKDQAKGGTKSKIVVDKKVGLESDETAAGMKAIRSIPEEYAEQLDQIEVVVKPF